MISSPLMQGVDQGEARPARIAPHEPRVPSSSATTSTPIISATPPQVRSDYNCQAFSAGIVVGVAFMILSRNLRTSYSFPLFPFYLPPSPGSERPTGEAKYLKGSRRWCRWGRRGNDSFFLASGSGGVIGGDWHCQHTTQMETAVATGTLAM